MSGTAAAPGEIVVLAGTNGAGKSSVAGAALERQGGRFYNPDRATRAYGDRGLSLPEANSRAWHRGVRQLEQAIRDQASYAFATTLGGRTITRVAAGGHGIPEEKVRERWDSSRQNLIRLLPHVRELAVFDNSRTVDLAGGEAPRPERLLHVRDGDLESVADPRAVPSWAKPIVRAGLGS